MNLWTGPLSLTGIHPSLWENEASPRRRANAVTPGALTDQIHLEEVIG